VGWIYALSINEKRQIYEAKVFFFVKNCLTNDVAKEILKAVAFVSLGNNLAFFVTILNRIFKDAFEKSPFLGV